MLTVAQLRHDRPKDDEFIAVFSDIVYCPTNTNVARWQIISRQCYLHRKNKGHFLGWMPLPPDTAFNSGPAPRHEYPDGSINMVVARYSDAFAARQAGARVGTSNSEYYNSHLDEYSGWIDTEHVPMPVFPLSAHILAECRRAAHWGRSHRLHSMGKCILGISAQGLAELAREPKLPVEVAALRVFIRPGPYEIHLSRQDIAQTGHQRALLAEQPRFRRVRDHLR